MVSTAWLYTHITYIQYKEVLCSVLFWIYVYCIIQFLHKYKWWHLHSFKFQENTYVECALTSYMIIRWISCHVVFMYTSVEYKWYVHCFEIEQEWTDLLFFGNLHI